MVNHRLMFPGTFAEIREFYSNEEVSDAEGWVPEYEVYELPPLPSTDEDSPPARQKRKRNKINGRKTNKKRKSREVEEVLDNEGWGPEYDVCVLPPMKSPTELKKIAAKNRKSAPGKNGNKRGKPAKRPISHSKEKSALARNSLWKPWEFLKRIFRKCGEIIMKKFTKGKKK